MRQEWLMLLGDTPRKASDRHPSKMHGPCPNSLAAVYQTCASREVEFNLRKVGLLVRL